MGILSNFKSVFTDPAIICAINTGIGSEKLNNIRYKANWTDLEIDTGIKGSVSISKGKILVVFDDFSEINVNLNLDSYHKIKTFNGGNGWVWHGQIKGHPTHVSLTDMGAGGIQLRFDLSVVPGEPNEIVFLL